MSAPTLQIRAATPNDAQLLHELITALAVYEREPDAVKASPEDLRASLFGDGATAHALICEQDGQALGFAVYFFNYSTWLGRNGLYLEDLFVRPQARGQGAGLALLRHLARLAVQRGCGRFEWSVLDWNQPAIDFYQAAGARPMDGWTVYRLDGERLAAFAGT
ncbi:GNAT family N-acetyltransferase [Xanthomonas euroxanthea]|uniref:GNAT family N-acetyltransferase n=1 Tax=Xanthomonas euroxanthea TaxID=2259622 RepID=UPI001AF99EDD|nr:GNAT family N-acetyltransferase [Xanthomonas euroxanthea]CAG2083746.1 GNAT family N-acetyltransferase [Xanthomonas euroxanthea]